MQRWEGWIAGSYMCRSNVRTFGVCQCQSTAKDSKTSSLYSLLNIPRTGRLFFRCPRGIPTVCNNCVRYPSLSNSCLVRAYSGAQLQPHQYIIRVPASPESFFATYRL